MITKTFTVRSNARRAARAFLQNAAAQEGVDFTTYATESGAWAVEFAAARTEAVAPETTAAQPGAGVAEDDFEPPALLRSGAYVAETGAADSAPASRPADTCPAEAAAKPKAKREGNKTAAAIAAASSPSGVSNAELREMTGWTKLGGFFTACKRAGFQLRRVRQNGDTRWFAEKAAA